MSNVEWLLRRGLITAERHATEVAALRGVLIVVLCVVLATPIKASGYPSGGGIVAGVVAGLAAVVVTIVVIHRSSQKRTITGCVSSGENGMSVADQKDNQIFFLSANTATINSDDQLTLQRKQL